MNMSTSEIVGVIMILIGMGLVFLGIAHGINKVLENQALILDNQQEIMDAIQHRAHLDTLYWGHLEQCSFIRKDKVIIGFDGYLKVK